MFPLTKYFKPRSQELKYLFMTERGRNRFRVSLSLSRNIVKTINLKILLIRSTTTELRVVSPIGFHGTSQGKRNKLFMTNWGKFRNFQTSNTVQFQILATRPGKVYIYTDQANHCHLMLKDDIS